VWGLFQAWVTAVGGTRLVEDGLVDDHIFSEDADARGVPSRDRARQSWSSYGDLSMVSAILLGTDEWRPRD
jgi:hypothetical protein